LADAVSSSFAAAVAHASLMGAAILGVGGDVRGPSAPRHGPWCERGGGGYDQGRRGDQDLGRWPPGPALATLHDITNPTRPTSTSPVAHPAPRADPGAL